MYSLKPKASLWRSHWPTAILFASLFMVHELGINGSLPGNFLNERMLPNLRRVTAFFTDIKFKLRGKQKPKSPVVVLEIDSASIESFGRWPWRRDLIAFLIDEIFKAGAKFVATDMFFSEPEKRVPDELLDILRHVQLGHLANDFETDPHMISVIDQYRKRLVLGWATESPCQPKLNGREKCNVLLPEAVASLPENFSNFSTGNFRYAVPFDPAQTPVSSAITVLANIPDYQKVAEHMGFVNSQRDPDGLIRRSSVTMIAGGKPFFSLPMEMAQLATNSPVDVSFDSGFGIESLKVGGHEIPVTRTGLMEINFRGGERSFPYVSARDLLSVTQCDGTNCPIAPQDKIAPLKDAYVFLGVSAVALSDITATPFDATMPGVEAHAMVLDNILSRDMLIPAAAEKKHWLAWGLIVLAMLFGATTFARVFRRLEALPALLLFTSSVAFIFLIDYAVLFKFYRNYALGFLYLEMLSVTSLLLAEKYILEERIKKRAEAKIIDQQQELLAESMAKFRMESELKTAQIVQNTLLATPHIEDDAVSVSSYYLPATECGGDLWDASLQGNQLRILIGDATGHGAPAAIVTAVAKSCFSTALSMSSMNDLTPDECLSLLNRVILSSCRGQLLMTMCLIQMDLDTGEVLVGNAGHENPYWLKAPGEVTAGELHVLPASEKESVAALVARGERLGYSGKSVYKLKTYQLNAGDSLVLYTDGIAEAKDRAGKEWGGRHLRKMLAEMNGRSVEEIRDELATQVLRHTQGMPQADDITFVVVRWNGRQPVITMDEKNNLIVVDLFAEKKAR